jgi:ABC-type lipoprotein release transport system permease subunit
MADLDRSLAEVPLGFFNDVFAMDGAGHAIVIMAPSLIQVGQIRAKVEALLPEESDLVVHDWDALLPGLKQAIQADFTSAWFMYGILIVLVAFSVLNTQLMSVLERTKEFGVIMALGVKPGRLGRLVVLESALMGTVGLILGVILGGALVLWLGYHGFSYPGMEEMAGKFNLPSRIYPELSFIGLFMGPVIILVASVISTLYPAIRLRFVEPVKAMRTV